MSKIIDLVWDRVDKRFSMPAKPPTVVYHPETVPPGPSAGELQTLSDRPGNRWYGPRPGGRDVR